MTKQGKVPVNITITREAVLFYRAIGKGNLSLGIRLVAHFFNRGIV